MFIEDVLQKLEYIRENINNIIDSVYENDDAVLEFTKAVRNDVKQLIKEFKEEEEKMEQIIAE